MTRLSPFIRRIDPLLPFLIPVLAVIAALAVSAILLILIGSDPVRVYNKLFTGATATAYNRAETLGKATPLLLVAVGVCIAFRARVLNIGVEGQVVVGGLAATGTGLALASSGLPGGVIAISGLIMGAIAGAVWAAIPGLLKAYFGVNEILSSIMMN
jgi:simple sugar transport system permease protein